jgi:uncharacterized protein YaiE (UPF0345 family)
MGITNWGYTADESLGVLWCSWYTADEAEPKLMLVISTAHTASTDDSPLYQVHSERQSPLAHFPP